MKKSNKLAAVLVLVLAAITLAFAYMAKQEIASQRDRISSAENEITMKSREIMDKSRQISELESEVSRYQENVDNLQRSLQDREARVSELMDELAEQKRLAETASVTGGELATEVEQLRLAQSDLEAKLTEVQEARDRLQYMLEHGGATPSEDWQPTEVPTGEVIAAYEPSYLTLDFDSSIAGGALPQLYIQREGKIVGKVSTRKVHYTTLVTEVAQAVAAVRGGDTVRIEELTEPLPFFSDIHGTISAVHGMGFFSVDLGATDAQFHPGIKVLRDGVPVGDFNVDKVHLVTLVLEMDASGGVVELRKGDTVVAAN